MKSVWLYKTVKDSKENKKWETSGLRMHFDKGVDSEVYRFCMSFAKWLRKEFIFPLRVNVYIRSNYRIKAKDGDLVVGTMWRPADASSFPYIRLATGDYQEMVERSSRDSAMWQILHTFAHEITHYYQYINKLKLTLTGEERQAKHWAERILSEYLSYLETQGQRDKGTVLLSPNPPPLTTEKRIN